jgi:hypothetical protein
MMGAMSICYAAVTGPVTSGFPVKTRKVTARTVPKEATMPRGSIPPDMYESIVLQALRPGPLLPSPHLFETMIKLEERRHAWRQGIEDDDLQKERAARLERAGYLLVVGAEYLTRLVTAILRHVARCLAGIAATVREIGTSKHG